MRFLIIVLLSSQLLSQDLGKKMIDNGDFDSALNYYQYLLDDENLSKDDIIYNLATIYSSIDSLKKAEKYFDLAMQDSLNPSSDLSYNRGNMFFKSQMLEESLKSFRDALLKNPEDEDARKNYEFVKNELKKINKLNSKINKKIKIAKNQKIMITTKKKIKIKKTKIRTISQIILIKILKKIIMMMVLKIRTRLNQASKKIMNKNKLKLIRMLKIF